MTASSHTGPGRETRRRAAVPGGDGDGVEAARRGDPGAVYCVSRVRRGVLLCCDITSTIRRLYDPHSKVYDALRAEHSRKMIKRWADEWGVKMRAMMKTPEYREKVSKGVSQRSEHLSTTCLEHISTSLLARAHGRSRRFEKTSRVGRRRRRAG